MFGKKRLVRVEVLLKHGGKGYEDIKEIIEILPGQTFLKEICADYVMEGNTKVECFNWRAGYTVEYTYLYV